MKRKLVVASLGFGVVLSIVGLALTAPYNVENVVYPTTPPAPMCGNSVLAGPTTPPPGSVIVPAGDNSNLTFDFRATETTFYFETGIHTLGTSQFDQIQPGDGTTFIGAPGAILDGQNLNRYAFTQHGLNVTIKFLTITGFQPPLDEGVVNHDSGNGWIVENNTVELNGGAALMAGDNNTIRNNCLRSNGQYGLNAYQGDADGPVNLLLEGNEFVNNNTLNVDLNCGCSGAMKLWSVDKADIVNNWIHDNNGAGIWADNNNNDFLIAGNLIEGNSRQAIFYEQSYNGIIRDNNIRNNSWGIGRDFSDENNGFPIGTIYVSESGGDARIPARNSSVEITANLFENNWGGVVLWENADRFCNSPANTGSDCTLPMGGTQDRVDECSQPGIASEPLYSDCRWKTQNVDIHDNTFNIDPTLVDGGCPEAYCALTSVFSNVGSFPDWSPYRGSYGDSSWNDTDKGLIQRAITFNQNNRWHDNTYNGPWSFKALDMGPTETFAEWQAAPYNQDVGSIFNGSVPPPEPPPEPPPPPPPAPDNVPLVVVELDSGLKLVCPIKLAHVVGDGVNCTFK